MKVTLQPENVHPCSPPRRPESSNAPNRQPSVPPNPPRLWRRPPPESDPHAAADIDSQNHFESPLSLLK